MTQIKKKYSNEFKAQVALSALREEYTVSSLSSQYGVHPTQINQWKRQALSGMKNIFADKANKQQHNYDNHVKDLHAKIGQLTVEKDFLVYASNRLVALRGKK